MFDLIMFLLSYLSVGIIVVCILAYALIRDLTKMGYDINSINECIFNMIGEEKDMTILDIIIGLIIWPVRLRNFNILKSELLSKLEKMESE